MYTFLDATEKYDSNTKARLLYFMELNGLTEDDISYETLYKRYYRYKKKKNKFSQNV